MLSLIPRFFYVDTSLGQIHGRLYPNKGPTIVCFHPMPYSSGYYQTFCNNLIEATDFSVVSLDMLGYGQSSMIDDPITIQDYAQTSAEAIQTLIRNNDINPDIILLGFHSGSAIANEMTIIEPKLMDKAIFVTYPFFDAIKRKEMITSLSKTSLDDNLESLRSMWEFTVSDRAEGVPLDRALSNFRDQLQSIENGWFGFHSMFHYPSEERLPLSKVSSLVLNDQSSLTEPTNQAYKILTNAQYKELEKTKGAIFELNTDQIIHHIESFILS